MVDDCDNDSMFSGSLVDITAKIWSPLFFTLSALNILLPPFKVVLLSYCSGFLFLLLFLKSVIFGNFLNLFWYLNSADFIVGQSSQRYYCAVTVGDDAVISAFRLVGF